MKTPSFITGLWAILPSEFGSRYRGKSQRVGADPVRRRPAGILLFQIPRGASPSGGAMGRNFVHPMHKVPGSCRPPRHIPCGWNRKNPSTYKWFLYKLVFPQKNLQTKFDKAIVSRILKTYPVIWVIAASCLATPSVSSYTGFGGGDMLEQNRQNAYAEGAGTARA